MDEDGEVTQEGNEKTVDSETNDASEAAPADTGSNEEEGSVQSDAGDTLETEPPAQLGGRGSIHAVSK